MKVTHSHPSFVDKKQQQKELTRVFRTSIRKLRERTTTKAVAAR